MPTPSGKSPKCGEHKPRGEILETSSLTDEEDSMFAKIDDHARATWHRYLFNLWMILRLNVAGTAFATLVAGITALKSDVDASLAGFALSFALQYTVAMEWTVRQYSSTQMSTNSTERIFEYSQMPAEDASGEEPPARWPSNGSIAFLDVWAGYTLEQPVLKGLSFRVNSNERIGIVGRTGAGKSSLALTLFRFLEISTGRILIDGIDILSLRLSVLRSRLAIIPQDSVLFAGTIRTWILSTSTPMQRFNMRCQSCNCHLLRQRMANVIMAP